MNAQRTLIPAVVLVAGLACSATAQAQPNGNAWDYSRNHAQAAYNNGYRSGYDRGQQDARRRRYDYGRHKEYRGGDWGDDRRDGDRSDYRRVFQQGFIAGYDDGFYGRGSRSLYSRTEPGYNRYPTYPTYPSSNYPTYPTPTAPTYGREGGYGGYGISEGSDRGYRDGLDKGRGDGKDRDRYDPRRQKWYRDADRGYRREYGPRERYESAYREGFLRGYDEGYRSPRRW